MRVNERMKKVFSILLCLCMVLQYVPTTAFAVTTAEDGLCAHHTEHTADCGYAEAVEGQPCTHVHDELCGYIEAVAEVKCACEATDENGALVHTEGCGYVAPVAGSDCTHVHDGSCGYVQAVEAHECHYECAECENSDVIANQSADWCGNPLCSQEDAFHVTSCPQYVAPENPQCYCAEKCTEANVWCDICGFDYTQCGGTDRAVGYDGHELVSESLNAGSIIISTSGEDVGIKYRILSEPDNGESGTVSVYGHNGGVSGEITIPGILYIQTNSGDNYSFIVTAIDENAFQGCSDLTFVMVQQSTDKVSIWDSESIIETIGDGAFKGTQVQCATHRFTASAACDVCDYVCGHAPSENAVYTVNDDGTHSFTCTVCSSTVTEDHRFDFATGKCWDCGYEMAEASVTQGESTDFCRTLGEAVAAASKGTEASPATLTLLKDIDLGNGIQSIFSGVFTLDLNDCVLKSSGNLVLRISGGDVTIADNGADDTKTGTITGYNGVDVLDGGIATISGGSITGDNYGVYVENGAVTISGGSISGGQDDLFLESGTASLTLDDGKTEGATFLGGITVYDTTLAEILGEGASYWAEVDGKDTMLTVAADATSITDKGDITIRAICDHSGNTNDYTNNNDGTHSFTCTVCQTAVTEAHTFTDGVCSACGYVCPHSNFDSATGICGDCQTSLAIAKVEIGGNTIYYQTAYELSTSIENNSADQAITLLANFEVIRDLSFYAGEAKNTLDLNGHTLTGSSRIDVESGKLTITGPGSINIFMTADNEGAKIVVGSGVTLNNTLRSAYGGVLDLTNATIPEAGLNVILYSDDSDPTTYNVSDVLLLPADYYFFVDGKVVSSYSVETEGTVLKHTEHSYTYTDNGDGTHDATCTACGAVVDNEAHTPAENATCTTLAVCDTCGKEYGELAAHTPDANGKCTAEDCGYQYAAKIGDTFYETIHKALRAAEGINGCTLTLLDDVTLSSMSSYASYVNTGTFTLDLNGKTLSSNKRTLEVMGSADLTIRDSIGDGKIVSTDSSAVYLSGDKLTIESGIFEGSLDGVFLSGTSTLIVKGGTFTGSRAMITGFGSNVEIDLTAIDPSGLTLKNNGNGTFAPRLPSGYAMVNGNGTVVTSLNAEESATVKASLENATVTLSENIFVYDGQPHMPTVTVALDGRNLTEGTDYQVLYMVVMTMTNDKPTKWFGDHTTSDPCVKADDGYYAVIVGMGNYYTADVFTLYKNFVIEPRLLTIKADDQTIPVGGSVDSADFTITEGALVEGHTLTAEVQVADSTLATPGTYTNVLCLDTDSVSIMAGEESVKNNYSITLDTGTLTIVEHIHEWTYTAKDDTITATCGNAEGCPDAEQSFTLNAPDVGYSGNPVEAEVTRDATDLTFTLHYTGTNYDSVDAPTNAGDYTVTMTVGDKSVSDTFTISPKDISKVASCQFSLTRTSFVYSGKSPVLNVTGVDSSVGSYTMQEGTDYTVGTVQVNAGSHKLTVTGIGNYTGTVELAYTITAKEVSITGAVIQSVTYDPNGYTLNVTSVTFDGVVDGETLAYTAEATLGNTNAVGEQDATVTVTLNNSNYTLEDATYETTVTINKAEPEVVWNTGYTNSYGKNMYITAYVNGVDGEMIPGTAVATVYDANGNALNSVICTKTDSIGTYFFNWLNQLSDGTYLAAESYVVELTYQGNENYNAKTVELVTYTIAKADPVIGTVGCEMDLYDSTAISNVELIRTDMSVEGTLVLTDSELTAGEGTYNWKFTPEDTDNYNTITGTVVLTVTADVLEQIKATGTLEKFSYVYGEPFSIDGMTVTAEYTSGTTKDVTGLVSFDRTLAVGQTAVELTYQGKICVIDGITVAKKQLDVSGMAWDVPENAVYSGTAYTAVLTGELPEGVSVIKTGDTATNAGNYTARAVFSLADGYSADNYEIVNGADLTAEWSIGKAKAEITVDTTPITVTYGETVKLPTATTNFGTVSCDKTANDLVNVGTYTVTYTVAGTANFDGDTDTVTVTINAKEIIEEDIALNGSLVYTGSELTQAVTVADGITYEISGNKATNVGDYELTVKGTGNYTGEVKLSWSIKEAAAVVGKAPTAKELTYTGTAQALVNAGTTADGKLVYSLSENGEFTESIPTGTNAGEYTVWYYVQGDDNHSDTAKASVKVTIAKADPVIGTVGCDMALFDSTAASAVELTRTDMSVEGTLVLTDSELTAGEGTYNWKFTPKDTNNYNTITGTVVLNVTADVLEKIEASGTLEKDSYSYGDTFSIDGLTVTATYTTGATKDVTELVSFDNTLAVGQTSVKLTYQGKTCTVTGFTVAKKQLIISGMAWDIPENAVYSGTAYNATLTGNLPEGVTVTKTGDTATNAGDYTAKAVFSLAEGYSADNYEIVNGEDLTADWTIAKKNIAGAQITLGTALTYNGKQQTQTVTKAEIDGLTVTYTVSGNTGTDAKDYTLTITGNGNFEGTETKEWSIAKKNISGATITLGDSLTYIGNEQTQEVADVKIGDLTVTYDVTANKQTNAGNYTLTVTGNGNFEGSATADWSIAKAKLTITANNNSITYGDIPAANGVTGTGFVSSESIEDLSGELTYSYNYEQFGNVGTYKITPSGVTSNNYEITFADGTLTVNAKAITVTADAVSKTYGDVDPKLTYKVEGLVNGDELTGELKRVAGENVGDYAIEQNTLTAGNNYRLAYTGAKLTIKAKAITAADVKLNGSLTYNGKEQTQAITVTEGITYEVTGNKATNAGAYELTVKGTGNYTGSVTLDWTIAKAKLTITADSKVIYIGEKLPTLTYTVSGLVDGDKLTKEPALTTNADADQAGSYTITAANADAGMNYAITYVGGTLTIMDKNTEVETKVETAALTEVPDGLKNTKFNTVEAIKQELTSRIVATSTGFVKENMAHYDVTLQFSLDGRETWILATEENFPTEGIIVTLPYPYGTNAAGYDFVVSHMFTVTSQRLGTTAGDVELPSVTETASGIRVTLKGLSPVTLAWRATEFDVKIAGTTNGTVSTNVSKATSGTEITVTVTPKYGYKMATLTVKDASGKSYAVSTDNSGKYYFTMPSADVTVTATFSKISSSTADTTNPKTGDDFQLMLWSSILSTSAIFLLAALADQKRKLIK